MSAPVQRSLVQVAGPLWAENLLRTSLTTVDVFMLSFFSEQAVAAVGLANQFVFFVQLLCMMVASGSSILLAQYLGAGRRAEAQEAALASVVLVAGVSLAVSLALGLGAPFLLSGYGLAPVVRGYAVQFITIYAVGAVFPAFSLLQSALLRVHGDTKSPMYVNMTANLVNIAGNSLALFGWFGLPVLGVWGVAVSTVAAQALACLLLNRRLRQAGLRWDWSGLRKVRWTTYRAILGVGVPSAGEMLSYNLAQIVNMRMVAGLGTGAMAAFVYLGSYFRYVFVTASSIANATQIKVGWWVGAGEADTAARRVWVYWALGAGVSLVTVLALNLAQEPLFSLFTHDPAILALVSVCLLAAIALEFGRSFNLILIAALKGAGDVRFPVYVGIVSMWLFGVGGTWLFLQGFGWGLVGMYVAVASDECLRGLVMVWRWASGRWRGKSFAGNDEAVVGLRASVPAAEED